MTLSAGVLQMLEAIASKHGWIWATAETKRAAMEQLFGKCPGERSIDRVERTLEAEGKIRRSLVLPGGRLPDGTFACYRTVVIQVASLKKGRRC